MFALDLFNNDHERRLTEGAVDNLEQRRIDDLVMKMDDLAQRARTVTDPQHKAALAREFQKVKAERDSYYKVRNETMGYGGLVGEEGIPGNVPADKIPGKEDLLKGKGRSYYEEGTDETFSSDRIALFGKINRVIQSIETPEQYANALGFVKRAFQKLNDQPGGPEFSSKTIQRIHQDALALKADLAAKARELGIEPQSFLEAGIPGNVPTEKIPGKEDLLKGKGRKYYEGQAQKKNSKKVTEAQKLHVGDPIIVTAANEFEGKTGEIAEFSPSGKFVVVNLYNHGEHSMHLSDVEFNQYAADQEDEDDWYDDGAEDTLEEQQLDEATAREVILALLDKFYADMKLPPRQGSHSGALDIKSPGTQVWTRGDGTRLRDPGRIQASYWADDKKQAEKAAAKFWPWLLKQPGVKSIGQVSGQFGSSPLEDAVSYKGLYFKGGPRGVEFGSMSRVTNPKSVWRHKPFELEPKAEQGVKEGFQDFNKVEPYEVCLAGKPVKTFDYYEDARRFHDNWKKKLYREGNKEKADRITLNPVMKEAQLDELNPETLKSYLKKSKNHSQKYDQLGNKADDKGDEALANKMWNKGDNRYAGAEQARVKLADLKDKKKGVAEDWIDDDAAEPLARYFADLYYGDFSATYKVKLTSHIYQAIQNGELSIDQLKADIDMLEKEKGIKEGWKQKAAAAALSGAMASASGVTLNPNRIIDGQGRSAANPYGNVDSQGHVIKKPEAPKADAPKEKEKPKKEVKEDQTKFVRTHKPNCGWNYGHDCDCGGTLTHAKNCGHRFGHDCDCGLDKAKQQGVTETGLGMWGDKGHNAKSQATKDLERSRNEKKQAAERARAEERDRAWWKAQSQAGKEVKEDQDTSGVESAIIRRIMVAHTDLLKQFGPEKVMQAAEEVAYNVGDVDEIGSSDVSAYVHQVKQILGATDEEQLDELEFLGSPCTKDCSGHRAGYEWSTARGGVDGNSPYSPSFNNGARLAKDGK